MQLLFDLDGTLTDSAPGIVQCINHALGELRATPPSEAQVRALIGTPLRRMFRQLLSSDDATLLDRAIECYRARFDERGILESALFPGIADALDDLHTAGHRLQLVTAKPAAIAQRVLDRFEIARFFQAVHGASPEDENCDKAQLIGVALRDAVGTDASAAMIGDRADDVVAARANGILAVGVAWGYGSSGELIAARPTHVVQTISELVAWVDAAADGRLEPRP